MKTLLKSLIVWFMLLAVPFQGFASATMLFCAPMQSAALLNAISAVPTAPHDHQAMLSAERAQPHHHDAGTGAKAGQAGHADSSTGHHAAGKCNSCATCCFGASMAPSYNARLPVDTPHFAAIPFDIGFVPTVDLAFPERPPQASLT